jgi:hypothetical protein
MPPRAEVWPTIITVLAREVIELARSHAVHGRLRIRRTPDGYAIVILIPAGETVMAQAWRSSRS